MSDEVWTRAAVDADKGMKVVDGLLSFMSETQGRPTDNQKALYVAAIAFAYAVWENYVEDLAIELVERMAPDIDPAALPDVLVARINDGLTPWQLSVSPGWRQVWIERVTIAAKGDGVSRHGLSMARSAAVEDLFGWVGVSPSNGVAPSLRRLDELVDLRNSVVHTGKIPPGLKKAEVLEWRQFVQTLYESIDKGCRGMTNQLYGGELFA